MDALNHLRQEIDALDRELIQLFAKTPRTGKSGRRS